MYIQGSNITISSSFPRPPDNYRIIYTFREGDKQFLKLVEGTVMTIDGDRLLRGRAIYILDNNPIYYPSTTKYQYY